MSAQDRIDKMRRKQQQLVASPSAPVVPASATVVASTAPPAPKRPKVDKIPGEVIVRACGHSIGLRNLLETKCPACATEDRKARAERRRAKRLEKGVARNRSQRLPDESRIYARYDAVKEEWVGELTVRLPATDGSGAPDATQVFTDTSSGVMRLLQKLDAKYREWETGRVAPAPPG